MSSSADFDSGAVSKRRWKRDGAGSVAAVYGWGRENPEVAGTTLVPVARDPIGAMRHETSLETPNLFAPELLTRGEAVETVTESPETSFAAVARDFVAWCCSFGSDFRNSPDITNLRVWLRKGARDVSSSEEEQILLEARRLFLKKVELAVRKADVPKDKD